MCEPVQVILGTVQQFTQQRLSDLHSYRLMDGVRRWMGSGSSSVPHAINNEVERDHDVDTNTELEGLDPNSMEGIVWRLLSPSVPEEEEAEYEGYVHPLFVFTRSTCIHILSIVMSTNIKRSSRLQIVPQSERTWICTSHQQQSPKATSRQVSSQMSHTKCT